MYLKKTLNCPVTSEHGTKKTTINTSEHQPDSFLAPPGASGSWTYLPGTGKLQLPPSLVSFFGLGNFLIEPAALSAVFSNAQIFINLLNKEGGPFEVTLMGSREPNHDRAFRVQGWWESSTSSWHGTIQDISIFLQGRPDPVMEVFAGDPAGTLHVLINNTEESFLFVDTNRRIIMFNRQFELRFAALFNVQVLHGDDIVNYTAPGRREMLIQVYEDVFAGKRVETEVEVNVEGRGTVTYLNRFKPAYNGEGKLVGAFVTSVDVTVTKNTQRVISAHEDRFRSLVENGGDAITILMPDGTPIYVSPSIQRVLGYSEEEAMQLNLFDIIHPAYVDSVKKVWQEMLGSPGVPTPDHISRIRHKDGTWRWIEATVTNLLDDPAIGGFVDNFRDVTARVIADKEMAKTQQLLKKAESLAQLGSAEVNLKKGTIQWSDGLFRIHGLAPGSEITVEKALGYLHTDDRPDFESLMAESIAQQRSEFVTEFRLTRADGMERVIWVQATIQYNDARIAERIFAVVQDISERKQNELALQSLHQEIAIRADELARSNEELEKFAYVASHDLQEPLRMVSSFLQLLQRQYSDQLDAKAKDYINYAVDGSNRMKRLIMDLLEYSRVGTNRDSFATVDLDQVLHEISVVFEPQIKERNAILTIHKMPEVQGVRTQLNQLFQNLLGNALKYNTSEVPQVEIGFTDHTTEWEFFVKDNGIGIDEKFYEKIFVIFQRLHNRNNYSGTGIGLAICKKIVERHGGGFRIESALGKGTTFFFTILK